MHPKAQLKIRITYKRLPSCSIQLQRRAGPSPSSTLCAVRVVKPEVEASEFMLSTSEPGVGRFSRVDDENDWVMSNSQILASVLLDVEGGYLLVVSHYGVMAMKREP